jgi:glycosyltransferase involved in cell wall biosynthesis
VVKRRTPRNYDVAFYVPRVGPLLTDSRAAPTGGAETQIFLLARGLARLGTKVCLLVFELPGVDLPSSIDDVAVSVRPPYRAHEPLGRLRETITIGKAIANIDADVIVTRVAGPETGVAGLFAKLLRRKFVYSSANVMDFDLPQVWPKRRNQKLFGLGVHLADEIVVQTREQVRMCEERFGRSPVLIRSIAEPAPQRAADPEAFLWIGRLAWYKRPFAFVELARSLPEARFWMVPVREPYDPDGYEFLARLEASAASTPNLELLPPRPRAELMYLVQRAVAIVNTADYEGMPNIFLEGWARGVPALALTHDPDRIIERHDLGGFADGSSEVLLELARSLWQNRSDQAELAARCREYVRQHHSSEAVSARWQMVVDITRRR